MDTKSTPTTFHLQTRETRGTFCRDVIQSDTDKMFHRRTKQIGKCNCPPCLILWDMWINVCSLKPPLPSIWNMQKLRRQILYTMRKENKIRSSK